MRSFVLLAGVLAGFVMLVGCGGSEQAGAPATPASTAVAKPPGTVPPAGTEEDEGEYELDVINSTGFPDYMLIVWDYVKFARSNGIPALPRGSAGASLVLYCLFITDVDPVKNKLLFGRFLSPERLEMPDIDTDFADSRRGEILNYIAGKYGRPSNEIGARSK